MTVKDFSRRVFKGMNHKMNYSVEAGQVTDLADNIPLVAVPTYSDESFADRRSYKLLNTNYTT